MNDNHESNPRVLNDEILGVYQDICDAFATLDYDTVLENFAAQGMVKISQGQLLRGKEELVENWRQRIGDTVKLRIRIESNSVVVCLV